MIARFTPRQRKQLVASALALACCSLQLPVAHAADWTNPAGGFFNVGANWDTNVVPGPADIAQFSFDDNPYTVTFNNNPTTQTLAVDDGNLTFQTDGTPRTYTVLGTARISDDPLILGVNAATFTLTADFLEVEEAGHLTINAGNIVSVRVFDLGTRDNESTVVVNGGGSLTVSDETRIGRSGSIGILTFQNGAVGTFNSLALTDTTTANTEASLTVQSAASVTVAGDFNLGTRTGTGQRATLLVTGTGSSFTQSGATTFTAGSSVNNDADITVSNGGVLSTGTGAITLNRSADLVIDATGTFNANGDFTITDGFINSNGTFNLAAGKNFTAQVNAQAHFAGSFNVMQTFTIQSGADVSVDGYFDLAFAPGATANLIVTGTGTSLTTAGDPFWGANGGNATATFSDGASVTVNGSLYICAVSATAATTANISIQSGATLNVDSLFINDVGGATSAGSLTVTGAGSAIIQAGAATLQLGHALGTGAASLHVNSAGTFTSGTGTTTINPAGTISINGGTFHANGHITVNGGKILNPAGTFNHAPGKFLTALNIAEVSLLGTHQIVGGSIYSIESGSDFSTTGSLHVGEQTSGSLTVTGAGSTLTVKGLSFWGSDGGSGIITITDHATATVNAAIFLGRLNTAGTEGRLTVSDGATMTVSHLNIATSAGTVNSVTGAVMIDGVGSSITQTGNSVLNIGSTAGSAYIQVDPGGTFTSGTGDISIGKSGSLTISGTFNANGHIFLSGGRIYENTGGTFNHAAGKNITATANAQIGLLQAHTIGGGSVWSFASGADFFDDSYVDVGNNSTGALIIDGAGSVFTTTGEPFWGANGSSGTVTIRNGAAATVNSDLQIAVSPLANTSGILSVETGATLSVASLRIAPNGGPVSNLNGSVTVTGALSAITQTGPSTLTIGNATTGTASLNVTSGATFNTGTGDITVNKTGALTINGGTFNAHGNILLNGGTLQYNGPSGFNLDAGKNLTAENNAQVNFVGNQYAIQNGTTFTMQAGADFSVSGLFLQRQGTLTLDGAGTSLAVQSSLAVGNGTGTGVLTILNGATAAINSDLVIAIDGPPNPVFHSSGVLNVSGAGSTLIQTGPRALTIGRDARGSAILNVNSGGTYTSGTGLTFVDATGTLSINAGTFIANGTLVVQPNGTLTIAGTNNNWSGKLDLKSSKAIIHTANAADKTAKITTLVNQIKSAGNGGTWTGQGITSSTLANAGTALTSTYAVGIFDNLVLQKTSFAGQPLTPFSLIVQLARLGDTNLDGIVDINDLGNLANNWQQSATTWSRGDFNMDGFVDINDLGILASNWQQSSAFPLTHESFLGGIPPINNVPEPATLLALSGILVPLLLRRKRLPAS